MSLSHFFKHLTLTSSYGFFILSRHFIRPPLKVLFTSINTKIQPLFPRKISLPFPQCYSSLTEPQTYTPYLSVRIRCRKEVSDMFSEALMCFGASSIIVDEDDNSDTSNEICIESIFPVSADVGVCISLAANSVGLREIPSYEVKTGEQYDWIEKFQESYDPVEVTEKLWIVPKWKNPPDAQATNIILNPGLAFGTGEHPTTRMCLLLLQRLIKGGERFLDYGTGSGILAIAALKFGASLSVGIDVDPQAITAARQNAALNNIGPENLLLRLVSDETSSAAIDEQKYNEKHTSYEPVVESEPEKYDIVIANILLNPLLELADNIISHAKPGATIGLSGILSEQGVQKTKVDLSVLAKPINSRDHELPDIVERYSPFLESISVSEMDDWACLSGTKRRILTGS